MSLQEYEDLVSEMEVRNDDLRYRLTMSTSEHESVALQLHDVLLENEDMRKQLEELEEELQIERQRFHERELLTSQIVADSNRGAIPLDLLATVQYQEERDVLLRKLSRAEEDVTSRDRLIDEFEITVDDLHKQYRNNCVDNDIVFYEQQQKVGQLEERLARADYVIEQQSVKVGAMSGKQHELEEAYSHIVEQYNEQVLENEQLADKLTATEFDLYATVDKLDGLALSADDVERVSVGTLTDTLHQDLENLKLVGELESIRGKYESCQYRISELSVDNTTLESTVYELEKQVSSLKRHLKSAQLSQQNSPAISPLPGSEHADILALKLEEFQLQNSRRERELLSRQEELAKLNLDLAERIATYEDEIFELSEQITQMELVPEEGGDVSAPGDKRTTTLRAIGRRLSLLQEDSIKLRDQQQRSPLTTPGKDW